MFSDFFWINNIRLKESTFFFIMTIETTFEGVTLYRKQNIKDNYLAATLLGDCFVV